MSSKLSVCINSLNWRVHRWAYRVVWVKVVETVKIPHLQYIYKVHSLNIPIERFFKIMWYIIYWINVQNVYHQSHYIKMVIVVVWWVEEVVQHYEMRWNASRDYRKKLIEEEMVYWWVVLLLKNKILMICKRVLPN